MSSPGYCHKKIVQFFFTDTKTSSASLILEPFLYHCMPLLQVTSEHTPTGNLFPLFDVGVTGSWTDSNHHSTLDSKLFQVAGTYLDLPPLERWKRQLQFIESTVYTLTTQALNVNRKFHQANRYILAYKLESTYMKEQKEKKSQNLPEIILFLQLLLKVLMSFFSNKYLRKQFRNILPLQQLVLRFCDAWTTMNFSADKQLFWGKLKRAMFLFTFVVPLGIVHANYSPKCCLLQWTPALGFQFLI